MVALTSERNTRMRIGDFRVEPVAAAIKIWGGSLVMRNAAGFLTKGATATGCVGVGRAEKTVDNTAGAAGAVSLEYQRGLFLFANSTAGDLITIADVGKVCFILDDQTVAKTDGTATRSRAGIVDAVEATGVWVRCDEALARAA
jgi:hypothetical protein